MGEMSNNLVVKPEGKRPHGKPKRRWEDNVDYEGIEYGNLDWIYLDQDRDKWRALVKMVMNFWIL
jgi:hypothetical protein